MACSSRKLWWFLPSCLPVLWRKMACSFNFFPCFTSLPTISLRYSVISCNTSSESTSDPVLSLWFFTSPEMCFLMTSSRERSEPEGTTGNVSTPHFSSSFLQSVRDEIKPWSLLSSGWLWSCLESPSHLCLTILPEWIPFTRGVPTYAWLVPIWSIATSADKRVTVSFGFVAALEKCSSSTWCPCACGCSALVGGPLWR